MALLERQDDRFDVEEVAQQYGDVGPPLGVDRLAAPAPLGIAGAGARLKEPDGNPWYRGDDREPEHERGTRPSEQCEPLAAAPLAIATAVTAFASATGAA